MSLIRSVRRKGALLVDVAAIACSEPAVVGQRGRGLLRPPEIPRRHVGSSQPDLHRLPCRKLEPDSGSAIRSSTHGSGLPADRSRCSLGPPVVVRIELHDAARGLGETVDPMEASSRNVRSAAVSTGVVMGEAP
jgi:hypothetical protein